MTRLAALVGVSSALLACSTVDIQRNDGGDEDVAASSSSWGGPSTATAASGTGGEQAGFGGFGGGEPVAACPDDEIYFIEHTEQFPELFEYGCEPNAPPTAAVIGGSKGHDPGTLIRACAPVGAPDASKVFNAETLRIGVGQGPLQGNIADSLWFSDTSVIFDEYGDVGQPVKGSYSGQMTNADGEVRDVSGTFTLCRGPDIPPTP